VKICAFSRGEIRQKYRQGRVLTQTLSSTK
jgi:hypothetical protein